MKLKSLKAALAPLTRFGQDEISFEISPDDEGSVVVYLRPLLPKEEVECQKRAREVLLVAQQESGDSEEVARAVAVQYFDMFRIEVISYALVQVGDESFRDVKLVETEEKLSNGAPIKIPLNKALRDLITESWARSAITICWSKYGELMTKIAQKAEKVVEQSLTEIDAEILRVSERLTKLKAEREERAKGDPSVTMDQIKLLTNLGNALEEEIDDTIQAAKEEREFQENLKKIDESFKEEEGEEEEGDETPPPPPRKPVTLPVVPPPTAKPPAAKPPPESSFVSSFEDPDSLEGLHQQEIEAMRILEAQKEARRSRSPDIGNDLTRAEPIGKVQTASGAMIDAFRLPTETISSRGGGKPQPPRPDPKKGSGNHNPNFVPSKK
jgi:hypothetical protein